MLMRIAKMPRCFLLDHWQNTTEFLTELSTPLTSESKLADTKISLTSGGFASTSLIFAPVYGKILEKYVDILRYQLVSWRVSY